MITGYVLVAPSISSTEEQVKWIYCVNGLCLVFTHTHLVLCENQENEREKIQVSKHLKQGC